MQVNTRYCRYRGCHQSPAYPKTTARMSDMKAVPQPVWRCRNHWKTEVEVDPIGGETISRPFPEKEVK